MHRSKLPRTTHAELLGAAARTYAEGNARLRTVAQEAAADMKRKADSAQVASQTRTQLNTNASPTH